MQLMLIAGVGGFFGTMMRYLVNLLVYQVLSAPLFPYGTLIINISGCFFIGLLASLTETRIALSPEVRIFIQIGILGGFTTFSTFGYETFALLKDAQFFLAASNVLLQVIIGMFAVWLGYMAGHS